MTVIPQPVAHPPSLKYLRYARNPFVVGPLVCYSLRGLVVAFLALAAISKFIGPLSPRAEACVGLCIVTWGGLVLFGIIRRWVWFVSDVAYCLRCWYTGDYIVLDDGKGETQ